LKDRCASRDGVFHVFAKRNPYTYPRLGIAVSKRVSKSAVKRNYIKRQIREFFRQNTQLVTGLDIVVLAQPGSSGLANTEIKSNLARHWQQITKKCGN
jgi:ribonuclease P protein component